MSSCIKVDLLVVCHLVKLGVLYFLSIWFSVCECLASNVYQGLHILGVRVDIFVYLSSCWVWVDISVYHHVVLGLTFIYHHVGLGLTFIYHHVGLGLTFIYHHVGLGLTFIYHQVGLGLILVYYHVGLGLILVYHQVGLGLILVYYHVGLGLTYFLALRSSSTCFFNVW